MKLIFSITILFLLSCKLNDKNSPRSSTQKLDLLDSQNYTEDFEIINDWFITSQFCKKIVRVTKWNFQLLFISNTLMN